MRDENKSSAIIQVIKDNNFQDTISAIGEVSIDTLFKDETLKDFPIIGTILGLTRTVVTVQEKLFIKKLMSFLYELKETKNEERIQQISKIELDPNYKTKIGEKLMFIIDKSEDSEKASLIGILFKHYIKNEIEYDEFLRATFAIEMTNLEDLKHFIREDYESSTMEEGGVLISSGLVIAVFDPGQLTHGGTGPGTLRLLVSKTGRTLRKLLKT